MHLIPHGGGKGGKGERRPPQPLFSFRRSAGGRGVKIRMKKESSSSSSFHPGRHQTIPVFFLLPNFFQAASSLGGLRSSVASNILVWLAGITFLALSLLFLHGAAPTCSRMPSREGKQNLRKGEDKFLDLALFRALHTRPRP